VLYGEPRSLKALRESAKRVATVVMQRDIVTTPKPLIRRDRDHCHSAGFQYAKCFVHSFAVIIDVFEHIERNHRIKASIHERKVGTTRLDDIRVPAFAAEIKGHWFDINARGRSNAPEGIENAPGTAAQIENPRLVLWPDSLLQ
jgi:hypothetical protein